MHHKTKQKLATATKIYLTEPEEGKTTELRIQLPGSVYVLIHLNSAFPTKVQYQSLSSGGFNYRPGVDPDITQRSKYNAMEILNNSRKYKDNMDDTIDAVIELVDTMPKHI